MAETAKSSKRKYVMGHRLSLRDLLELVGIDPDKITEAPQNVSGLDTKLQSTVIRPLGTSPMLAGISEAFELASEPFEDTDMPDLVVVAESSWNEETFEFEPAKRRLKKVTKEGGR